MAIEHSHSRGHSTQTCTPVFSCCKVRIVATDFLNCVKWRPRSCTTHSRSISGVGVLG